MTEQIVMVGFFHEAFELAQDCGCEVVGCFDRSGTAIHESVPWLGDDDALPGLIDRISGVRILLTPDMPVVRRRLYDWYVSHGLAFASLVSRDARVSPTASLGEGCFVQWRAHVSANVRLGRFVRLNVAANLMHDTTVGDFSTIAPNACLLGGVRVGEGCYIGANATVLPGRSVGAGAIVGAGAVVTRDVPAGCVVAGNPARPMSQPSPLDNP